MPYELCDVCDTNLFTLKIDVFNRGLLFSVNPYNLIICDIFFLCCYSCSANDRFWRINCHSMCENASNHLLSSKLFIAHKKNIFFLLSSVNCVSIDFVQIYKTISRNVKWNFCSTFEWRCYCFDSNRRKIRTFNANKTICSISLSRNSHWH